MTIGASGGYFAVQDFMRRLYELDRALRIDTITVAAGSEGGAAPEAGTEGATDTLTVQMTARIFFEFPAGTAPGAGAGTSTVPPPTQTTPAPAASPEATAPARPRRDGITRRGRGGARVMGAHSAPRSKAPLYLSIAVLLSLAVGAWWVLFGRGGEGPLARRGRPEREVQSSARLEAIEGSSEIHNRNATGTVETFEVFASRDPFAPLVEDDVEGRGSRERLRVAIPTPSP